MPQTIHMYDLIGHTDPNQDPAELDGTELRNLMHELARLLASATRPCVPGSIAHGYFKHQADAITVRYEACAAECQRRGVKVTRPVDTSAHYDSQMARRRRERAKEAS